MLGAFLNERGLRMPQGLADVYRSAEARHLEPYLYWPDRAADQPNSLDWALGLLRDAATPAPANYLPVLPVDELSIACVRCSQRDESEDIPGIVRWHLGAIDGSYQNAPLDIDVGSYVRSVSEELRARAIGLKKVEQIARRYYADFVERGIRPRGSVLRPVQLACQNVIIGLAAVRHDASFDGLQVRVYLTCEAPHLATHEANRALAALILCDAFQNGGTMEIRFGDVGNAEPIPPGLQRYARTIGLELGGEDACISPREARELFLAVTPMPDDLRLRCDELFDRGVISPERLCFTLMSSLWQPIELDYICATSARVASILRGGASADARLERGAETETCRAAVMLGMLQRHVDNADGAARSDHGVRVFEDGMPRVAWSIDGEIGAVALSGALDDDRVPWTRSATVEPATNGLICVPRGLPIPADYDLVRELGRTHSSTHIALLVPSDMAEIVPADVPVMVCPDRLAAVDADIERRLALLRVGRL